jgi:hypothetical protein
MHCTTCLKEFKNSNSLRVHRWRFHNPNSKYGKKSVDIESAGSVSTGESSLAFPVAAATVGLAAASGGNWKWLILLLLMVAVGILIWYLIKWQSEAEDRGGSR